MSTSEFKLFGESSSYQALKNETDEFGEMGGSNDGNMNNLYEEKRRIEENDSIAKFLRPYATFLVKYTWVAIIILIVTTVISGVLGIVPAAGAKDPPDFSDPMKGFQARGTTISSRRTSLFNLVTLVHKTTSRKRRTIVEPISKLHLHQMTKLDNHFILIYEHIDKGNLLPHMKSICSLHRQKILNFPQYSTFVKKPTHHLPNYIALLANRSDCSDITVDDANSFFQLVKNCRSYYLDNQFQECMNDESKCTSISSTCRSHAMLSNKKDMAAMFYNVFYYLTDLNFINNMDSLKQTSSIETIYNYSNIQENLFKPLYNTVLKDLSGTSLGHVNIAAYHFLNFKFDLLNHQIITQSFYLMTAIVLVIILIWFYSGSLFIGLMTVGCVFIASIIAYFVYGRVFDMDFFPFLNMVTTIFIVGIGADDAFVYVSLWEEAKKVYVIENAYEHVEYLIKWTIHTLRHALLAMFVTTLTTACAFYANMTSEVTSVKCFGLYSGTVIIIMYLLMATIFPVFVILHERYLSTCMHICCPTVCKNRSIVLNEQENCQTSKYIELNNDTLYKPDSYMENWHNNLDVLSSIIFTKLLPDIIIKFRFIWIVLCLLFGIGGLIVTFIKPGLSIPTMGEVQLFISSSSVEQYDLSYKKKFKFGLRSTGTNHLAYFVFGIKAIDNGNKFNPDDLGTVVYEHKRLDIASEQTWLLNFCKNVKQAPFYSKSTSCDALLFLFSSYASPCKNSSAKCCNYTIPIPKKDFTRCLYESTKTVLPEERLMLFDNDTNVKALFLSMETSYQHTDSFDENEKLYYEIDNWFDQQASTITTESFKGFWFVWQQFYDLQTSLFSSTKQALAISIAVAFVVILLTTWNIFLSIYSIVTISSVVLVTVGILIFSGWQLNILESVVFSVAAGLSADFTLHYSVAYKTSLLKDNRVERTKSSLSHIGPAIMMGAVTTFLAGLVMMSSDIIAYKLMAKFLMLLMFVSWIYSTFFFLPLCAVIGPVNNFGQFNLPKKKESNVDVVIMNRFFAPDIVMEQTTAVTVYDALSVNN